MNKKELVAYDLGFHDGVDALLHLIPPISPQERKEILQKLTEQLRLAKERACEE